MSEKYKNILNITGIRHQLIEDIIFCRNERLTYNDDLVIGNENLEKFGYFSNFDIFLIHFPDRLNLNLIQELLLKYKDKKYGLYLHTFHPFCDHGTLLFDKITKKELSLFFIKNLDFIITQDNFSFNFIKTFLKEKEFLKPKTFLLNQPIIEEKLICSKTFSHKFRLGFIGSLSYIKGFDFIKNFLNKFSLYLDNLGIEIYIFSLEIQEEFSFESLNFRNVKVIFNELNRKKIYSQIDCLLIPSVWNETGPMVLYEAFANKIPVIVSNQLSLMEKVKDRIDSYVFKTGDEKDFLKGILWMKKNYLKVISNNEGFQYNTIGEFNNKLTQFLNEL